MKPISKIIYLLNIDNYNEKIRALTYPLIHFYAKKIGAQVFEINKRKFPPEYPPVYEKLQIYKLAKEFKADWNIYIDADTLVHPDLMDITAHLPKDTVLHNGVDMAGNRWKYDEYFMRDGRNIGSCNWFTIASDWCVDLWKPLDDLTLPEALMNIFPIIGETNSGIVGSHLLDDYTLSRNIAKYGLKVVTFINMLKDFGQDGANYLWHEYQIKEPEKIEKICWTIMQWGVLGLYPTNDMQKFIRETAAKVQENMDARERMQKKAAQKPLEE